MKVVLVLGAGLSSSSLFRYLISHLKDNDWRLIIANASIDALSHKYGSIADVELLKLDANIKAQRQQLIARSNLVISMLPASFHVEVARDCIDAGIDLITPSYVSQEMKALHDEAIQKGVTIMNETGVDPGIDHMSAVKIMEEIDEKGGKLTSFKSFCGGLIAPESDDNLWHYKFTWNPRNVVLAGQGGVAAFRQNKELKYIPYNQLFKRTERFEIEGYGSFDGYANRDSLKYLELYNMASVETMYRGTLRRPDFCQAWDVLVELGLTEDGYILENSQSLTPRQLLNAFLPYHPKDSVETKLQRFLREDRLHLYPMFEEIGLFDNTVPIHSEDASPARFLQALLEKSWVLKPEDKDMLVMLHEFGYLLEGRKYRLLSSMVSVGEDRHYTAMANTVGLPMAIIAKHMLKGYRNPGVHLPIDRELYIPVLEELKTWGVEFIDNLTEIK
ncbi:MAG: saccharopine dehydrogenase [Flavobacteriia bacterium]|nr:saccharopine dehydrogenase [Flavobacteriia bacterium]